LPFWSLYELRTWFSLCFLIFGNCSSLFMGDNFCRQNGWRHPNQFARKFPTIFEQKFISLIRGGNNTFKMEDIRGSVEQSRQRLPALKLQRQSAGLPQTLIVKHKLNALKNITQYKLSSLEDWSNHNLSFGLVFELGFFSQWSKPCSLFVFLDTTMISNFGWLELVFMCWHFCVITSNLLLFCFYFRLLMFGFWLHYNHQCNLFCKFFSFLQFISYDLLVLSFRKMRVDSFLNCFSLLENNICNCWYETFSFHCS
jgi:hypothetical protein